MRVAWIAVITIAFVVLVSVVLFCFVASESERTLEEEIGSVQFGRLVKSLKTVTFQEIDTPSEVRNEYEFLQHEGIVHVSVWLDGKWVPLAGTLEIRSFTVYYLSFSDWVIYLVELRDGTIRKGVGVYGNCELPGGRKLEWIVD